MTTTPLSDIDPQTTPTEIREALAALPDLALFRVISHAERAFAPWLALGGALLAGLELDPRDRELIILQVAASAGSDYERAQHETIAAGSGVPAEQIAAVVAGRLDDPALAESAPVLRVVDELVRTHTTSTQNLDTLRTRLGDRRTVEMMLLVGHYLGIALLTNAAGVAPDAPTQMAVVDLATTAMNQA
jgi:4-carboxymuconolactone decarboxylase